MKSGEPVNQRRKRAYHAPKRAAAAARTRVEILTAAQRQFEQRGWAGTTIGGVAETAGVSPKTVEAQFGTKAALLSAVVDFAIRGDLEELPMTERGLGQAVEQAPDAAAMLERHAEHAVSIDARSARIAWTVEAAAAGDSQVAPLWQRMRENRRSGARWAADLLLSKPGARPDLTREEAERVFLLAIDWGTFRTLNGELGLSDEQVCQWLLGYYRRMLLAPGR